MKIHKKIDWKLKVILSILSSIVLLISLLSGITYIYFVEKIETNNKQVTSMAFKQAERDLKTLLEKAESHLNQISLNGYTWEFIDNKFSKPLEKTEATIKIVRGFDKVLSIDRSIYGLAILAEDGRTVVSTAKSKSQSGQLEVSEDLMLLMQKSRTNYPYVTWVTNQETDISTLSPLSAMTERPGLIGVKALNDSDEVEEGAWLLVVVDEAAVQNAYEMATYNGSEAVLLNDSGIIVSGTKSNMLGSVYEPNKADQNLAYELSFMNWKLINMIPKNNYLQESKDIRNFGIKTVIIAALGVLVISIVWSRKYINPMESLMKKMNRVGKGKLDIQPPEKLGWKELDNLNEEFYKMVQQLKYKVEELKITEQEKSREELRALQYQINPHFLYNSLNSIRWMAMMTNNTIVAETIVILNKLIIPVFRNPSFTWLLSDELEFIENYVYMMNLRHGNNMEYHLECSQALYHEEFPRFILQPIIENCFIHGSDPAELRHINVFIEQAEKFYVKVKNNDVSIDNEKVNKINDMLKKCKCESTSQHLGLSNIQKRLNILYGEDGRVWMERVEDGLIVHICF